MRQIFLAAFAVLTAVAASAQEEPDFRDVRWGMTDREVAATERGRGDDLDSGLRSYEVELFDRPAVLYYEFAGRYLIGGSYHFIDADDAEDGRLLLRAVVTVLRSKYGDELSAESATDTDLLLDRGQVSHTWRTDRTEIVTRLYQSSYLYFVAVEYDATDATLYVDAAAQDLSADLFPPTNEGRRDWRWFSWGASRGAVERHLGRPLAESSDGLVTQVMYSTEISRLRAFAVCGFDGDGALVSVTLQVPEDASPNRTDRDVIAKAVEYAYGASNNPAGSFRWQTNRSNIGVTLDPGNHLHLLILSNGYNAAVDREAARMADDF